MRRPKGIAGAIRRCKATSSPGGLRHSKGMSERRMSFDSSPRSAYDKAPLWLMAKSYHSKPILQSRIQIIYLNADRFHLGFSSDDWDRNRHQFLLQIEF